MDSGFKDKGDMGQITFIIGGARSGKSRQALRLANGKTNKVAFIATGQPLDAEMKRRIRLHQKDRPAHWETFEAPRRVADVINQQGDRFDVIIVDCLTLLVSNMMLANHSEEKISREVQNMADALSTLNAKGIIVSNEVGLGIVPPNKLAREFRDIAGRMNQIVAERSDRAFFMVSGIPWRIK